MFYEKALFSESAIFGQALFSVHVKMNVLAILKEITPPISLLHFSVYEFKKGWMKCKFKLSNMMTITNSLPMQAPLGESLKPAAHSQR